MTPSWNSGLPLVTDGCLYGLQWGVGCYAKHWRVPTRLNSLALAVGFAGILFNLGGSVPFVSDPYGLAACGLAPPLGVPVRSEKFPPDSLEDTVVNALRRGARESARDALIRLVLQEPENLQRRRALAAVFLAQQEFDAAQRQLQRLLERATGDRDEILFQLIWAHQGLGQGDEAARYSHELLRRRPYWSAAWVRHGLLLALDDPQAARLAFERALGQPFPLPTGLLEVGNYYLEQGAAQESLPFFERCLAFPTQNSWAANNLGNAHKALGNKKEARRYYQLAIQMNAKNPNPHNGLGVLAEEAGDWESALRSYRAAIWADAQYLDAHYNAGVVLLRLQRPREALASLEQARALQPDFALIYLHLSEALVALGDVRRARSEYEKAVALDPTLRKLRARVLRSQGGGAP